MSMEDILSSIRKYIAEEDCSADEHDSTEQHESDGGQGPVITLGQHDVASTQDGADMNKANGSSATYVNKDTYEEVSSLTENLARDQHKRSGPFDKLAEAFNAYGRNRAKRDQQRTTGDMTVSQLVATVAERAVREWMDQHLRNIVEELVMREIEKIKEGGE
ncbi:MAG: DUF2497 domain-containing protein [Holosporales bacterium]|nr:DUF2497 domain-containing protein [Holosporales bacterium]